MKTGSRPLLETPVLQTVGNFTNIGCDFLQIGNLMSSDKQEFYGKDVSEAIKKACESLSVPQEQLDIEVLETGSTGIFGLIRKKAHIRVTAKPPVEVEENLFDLGQTTSLNEEPVQEIVTPPVVKDKKPLPPVASDDAGNGDEEDDEEEISAESETDGEVSEETVAIVKTELLNLVSLMGFPSDVEISVSGISISCVLRGDFEEELAGSEGKVLDSLQYLLRKMISRRASERVRLSVNVGDFRERRLAELKNLALELANQVKTDGKTQVLSALNPSERRAIHMVLQEDKEIRSRSVGDGLFKKILIYKPGKGGRSGGRKRPQGRNRQNENSPDRKQNKNSE